MLGSVETNRIRWVGSERKVRREAIALMFFRFPFPSNSSSMPNSFATSLTNRLRLVDVEFIDHEDPPGMGVGGYSLCDVRGEVLIGAGRTYGGSDHPAAGCHLHQVGKQTSGAVAGILSCSWRSTNPGRIGSEG